MTNEQIRQLALAQSAIDCNCAPGDFMAAQNRVLPSRAHPAARRYLALPLPCDLVYYGSAVIATVDPAIPGLAEEVRAYLDRFPAEHCFETPNLYVLNDALQAHGLRVCFMAEYFLPEITRLHTLPCPFETRLLTPVDFAPLYTPEWSNALWEPRKELDVLGVGAYDGGRLVGLAACSADCAAMWQIGVDVLPPYRGRGIAEALTTRLALEILQRDKVPFYCAAWSNIKSVRNAVRCGFSPAWVELTAKPTAFVDGLNAPKAQR